MATAKKPQVKLESKKTTSTTKGKAKAKSTPPAAATGGEPRPDYEPSELVIKEIMVQKNVSREEAINILKNPA